MVPMVSDEYKQSHNFIEYFAETYMKPLNDIYDRVQAFDEDDSFYYDQWDSLADQYQEGLSTYKTAREAALNAYVTNRMSEVVPDIVDSAERLNSYSASFYDMDAVRQLIEDHFYEPGSTFYEQLCELSSNTDADSAYFAQSLSGALVDAASGFSDEFDMALDVYVARHSDTLLFGKSTYNSVSLAFDIDHGNVSNDFDSQASSHFDNMLVSHGALHRLEALAPEKHDTFEVSQVHPVRVYHDFGDNLVNGYRCLVGYLKSDTNNVKDINVVLLPLDDTGRLPDVATVKENSKSGSLPDLYKVVFAGSSVVSNYIDGFHDIGYRGQSEIYYFNDLLNAYDDAYHVMKSKFELEHEDSFAWERFEAFMNTFASSVADKDTHMASEKDINRDLTGETMTDTDKDTSKADSKDDFGE